MIKLIVVQPGRKLASLGDVEGDFADWILDSMGVPRGDVRVVYPQDGDALPALDQMKAVVITGASTMVTDGEAWIGESTRWLAAVVTVGLPVLGICFGHQLLAHALGGEVADNPHGIEVGTVLTRLTEAARHDPLFSMWGREEAVQASHRQSVLTLPSAAVRLASSDKDLNHAFRIGEHAWGAQFHPEFNRRIACAYTDYYRSDLPAQGDDADALIAAIRETPCGPALLKAFAALIDA